MAARFIFFGVRWRRFTARGACASIIAGNLVYFLCLYQGGGLTAEQEGIFFPVVTVGQDVAKDAYLGEVRDYFGTVLQTITAPEEAKVMNMNIGMPVKKDGFLIWLGQV